jgi:hypothetical protein
MKKTKTENTRIRKDILELAREYCEIHDLMLVSFVSLAIKEKLEKLSNDNQN